MAPSSGYFTTTGKAVIGALLAALVLLFNFLNGIPWERKGATAELRSEIQRELGDIKLDIREIRKYMERRERRP